MKKNRHKTRSDDAVVILYNEDDSFDHDRAAHMPPRRPSLPRPRAPLPPGVIRLEEWVMVHDNDLNRMMRFIQGRLAAGNEQWGVWDWGGVRRSLERYVYRNSANRFLDFEFLE